VIKFQKQRGGDILSFDNLKAWIITIYFIILAISSVYVAIKTDEIINRLATIAEFIGNTGRR
jgi:hypothetical protein